MHSPYPTVLPTTTLIALQMSWTKLICILIASVFTQLTNGEIPPDSQCGKAKICWPAECPAEGCVGFLISWWNTDLDYLRFEMKMEIVPSGEHYIALGFSGNNQMPDSSIVMCRSDDNVQLGYTQGRTYAPGTDLYGIRNTSFADTNNITTCSFDRIKKPTKNEDTLRSLTDSFFLIRAWGAVTASFVFAQVVYLLTTKTTEESPLSHTLILS
ncbi:ferric-chelate reductase 1 [Mizuhopecten yessoensis]|uniref:Ferric-chelate reductase 1 n=1 Tax=Mizuhopecten yessoensis TaxID=6573 RepID=A0A210Q599_MIZYE|nr:ferric-chelate reductase 1 [Mizuhopecten yessoensis]